ncbi:MAG: hypothetical protein KJT03_16505 [Verrucomicrobiae bacterium]|nr:hypothetical protein [Verrucomicrobiae bacterium]
MIHPIILRSNRFLGNNLVNHEFITLEQLEKANNILLDKIDAENVKEASLLRILMWEQDTINESDLIQFQVDKCEIGLVDLAFYSYLPNMNGSFSIEDCWCTWTVPFEVENGFYFLASAYYLSKPVIEMWEERLAGHVMWFATDLGGISNLLENAEQDVNAAASNT